MKPLEILNALRKLVSTRTPEIEEAIKLIERDRYLLWRLTQRDIKHEEDCRLLHSKPWTQGDPDPECNCGAWRLESDIDDAAQPSWEVRSHPRRQ
jgi:hypothetical protein